MIKQKEYARRRRQLMRMAGEDSIIILQAAPARIRNNDAHYAYRQDSDFYYLSGFPEPESVIVLAPGRKQGQYILFCRERDPDKERWDGARAGQEGARELYGADDSFPIDDLDDILPGMLVSVELKVGSRTILSYMTDRIIEWRERAFTDS